VRVELRVTQLLVAVAAAVLVVGVLLGRYVVPSGRPSGRKIELPGGQGTLYLSDKQARKLRHHTAASQAQTNVRASIPAVEAWYADHGTYAGATLDGLRKNYDYGLKNIVVARAGARTYCIESTVDGVTYSKDGPAAELVPKAC
jgi:hypothetical protein